MCRGVGGGIGVLLCYFCSKFRRHRSKKDERLASVMRVNVKVQLVQHLVNGTMLISGYYVCMLFYSFRKRKLTLLTRSTKKRNNTRNRWTNYSGSYMVCIIRYRAMRHNKRFILLNTYKLDKGQIQYINCQSVYRVNYSSTKLVSVSCVIYSSSELLLVSQLC